VGIGCLRKLAPGGHNLLLALLLGALEIVFGLIALAFVRTKTDGAGNRFTKAGWAWEGGTEQAARSQERYG
jgi:hypothetical protein